MRVLQVMLAEERLELNAHRRNYLQDNPQILKQGIDSDYLIDIAAAIFVPIENKKWKPFERGDEEEMKKILETAPVANFDCIREAISDFFIHRGKREYISTIVFGDSMLQQMTNNAKLAQVIGKLSLLKSAISFQSPNITEELTDELMTSSSAPAPAEM